MAKIGIVYTTFLRPELRDKTVGSICKYWVNTYDTLFVGDQSHKTLETKAVGGCEFYSRNHYFRTVRYYELEFDCGLSASRNYLINEAHKAGCEYILLTADSIEFTDKYMFPPIIEFLESNPKYGLVGFSLANRIPWEGTLELTDRFVVTPSTPCPITYNDISYQAVDICRNFFLAKTSSLLEVPYDNNLKIAEHEDFYWRYKQAGWKCFFTNAIEANYIKDKPTEYLQYRQRMYNEFKGVLMAKYGLKGWVKYVKNPSN